MSNFKAGQKVVCIDDSPGHYKNDNCLIKNEIYTIKGIYHNGNTLTLVEIPEYIDGIKLGYFSNRFRPLDHQFAEDVIAYITELELTPQH